MTWIVTLVPVLLWPAFGEYVLFLVFYTGKPCRWPVRCFLCSIQGSHAADLYDVSCVLYREAMPLACTMLTLSIHMPINYAYQVS